MKHKIKALGLVEILVVLGVFATSIIGISQFTTVAFVSIRKDELIEYGTGIMLQGLELAKSPSSITLNTDNTSSGPGSYKYVDDGGKFTLQKTNVSQQQINDCTSSSEFLVPTSGSIILGINPTVCGQIIVTSKNANGKDYLQFDSIVLINDSTRLVTRNATAYRFNETLLK